MNNPKSIITGSISSIAKQSGKSIAESFVGADVIVLVDTSGSMSARDSKNNQSRYDVACAELASLQQNLPGKVAVISFSSDVMFCPNGTPFNFGCSTDMVKALQFCKVADNIPNMRFILISDGEPDDKPGTLSIARTYKNKIDVIYVGSELHPTGRDFLQELARATGGKSVTVDRAKELQAGIVQLLKAG